MEDEAARLWRPFYGNDDIDEGKGRRLRRSAWFFLFFLMAGAWMASAETPAVAGNDAVVTPVTPAHHQPSWEFGPFINYGNGIGVRSDFHFLSAGFQLGKTLTPVVHAGAFSGQFELGGNIMPLWQAYTPAPGLQDLIIGGVNYGLVPFGGGTYRGVSVTPVIFRWNFHTKSERFQPWIQAAGGVIYTTHKFPPDELVVHGTPGGTCVWNFSSQGGGGIHIFTRARRSIDIGVNGEHISSASLGDRNPGVNASIQMQVGYTFWK
jgi:lipid A 3-O-deacylase